jgi:hypothetical protein
VSATSYSRQWRGYVLGDYNHVASLQFAVSPIEASLSTPGATGSTSLLYITAEPSPKLASAPFIGDGCVRCNILVHSKFITENHRFFACRENDVFRSLVGTPVRKLTKY